MIEALPTSLKQILFETPELAEAYLVGGCVRDWRLGSPIKDFDIEVFGIGYDSLVEALRRWGRADLVGRSFGVVKLTVPDGTTFDFTLSRRDSKTGSGHKGFAIEFDPAITPRDAAARRDFTINALMYHPRREELLDFFGGESDLRERRLRHTSPAFTEDPLRVLRGMQFAARFCLTAEPDTVELCRSIRHTFAELAPERVREEWFKWAGLANRPSCGLIFLKDAGWLGHFPELEAMIGVPQEPEWHPEGDVWTHTLHCLDALTELDEWRLASPETRVILTLAVLLHDTGKAQTTSREERRGVMRIISPAHEVVSGRLAESFLRRIGSFEAVDQRIVPLVVNHMAQYDEPSPRAVRRLANRLQPSNVRELVTVMTADASGRPPLPKGRPASVDAILAKAAELELEAQAPRPVLQGRHLIEAGMKPGREFGRILDAAFEAQLEGEFHDLAGARDWLARNRQPGGGTSPTAEGVNGV